MVRTSQIRMTGEKSSGRSINILSYIFKQNELCDFQILKVAG